MRYFSGYFRYRSTFFGVLMAIITRCLYRIPPEVFDKRCGENDEEYIERLDSATTDITGAINMARYGIVNCKREGDITARWRATESNKLAHRVADVVGKLRNFSVEIPHYRVLRWPILRTQCVGVADRLQTTSYGRQHCHQSPRIPFRIFNIKPVA